MSRPLAPPSPQLAERLLRGVPYDERLRVGRLVPPVGITAGDVRSVAELHAHLAPDVRSLPGVSVAGAARWIDEVVGDAELAEAVRALDAGPACYVDNCQRLHELLGLRLDQAQHVAIRASGPGVNGDAGSSGGVVGGEA